MARGRGGGAGKAAAVGQALLILMLLQSELCESRVYIVGDNKGWSIEGARGWLDGRKINTGDILMFLFNQKKHNVVLASSMYADHCLTPPNAIIDQTGNYTMMVSSGIFNVLSNKNTDCQDGMNFKFDVKAI